MTARTQRNTNKISQTSAEVLRERRVKMTRLTKIILALTLSFSCAFCCIGYATVTDNLDITGTAEVPLQEGVFIIRTDLVDSLDINESNTSVNRAFGTTMDSTVELSDNNGSSYATFKVTFFNNSSESYFFDKVEYLTEVYDNEDIVFEVDPKGYFIDAKKYQTIYITFKYDGGKTAAKSILNSSLNFSFIQHTATTAAVIEGNSADNLNSIYDGRTNYDGGNTQNRWTNWTSTTAGRGEIATINIIFEEAATIDTVKLFHFIDANQNANRYGSCDFPSSVKIYYYAEDTETGSGEYVELTGLTLTKNYSNEKRRSGDGVYQMTITDDSGKSSSVTFTHNYKSTPPISSYELANAVTTRGIRVEIDPKDNFFVGLMELQVLDENGDNVLTN